MQEGQNRDLGLCRQHLVQHFVCVADRFWAKGFSTMHVHGCAQSAHTISWTEEPSVLLPLQRPRGKTACKSLTMWKSWAEFKKKKEKELCGHKRLRSVMRTEINVNTQTKWGRIRCKTVCEQFVCDSQFWLWPSPDAWHPSSSSQSALLPSSSPLPSSSHGSIWPSLGNLSWVSCSRETAVTYKRMLGTRLGPSSAAIALLGLKRGTKEGRLCWCTSLTLKMYGSQKCLMYCMWVDHENDRHLEILITICLVPSRVQHAHTRLLV